MARYTPGPWKMRPSGELWSYSRGEAPVEIGTMSWGGRQEERDGNARIIAGAADLSESLDELMLIVAQPEIIEAIFNCDRISAKSKLIIENARATLEEVTGKKLPEWPKNDPNDKRLE
ncbi:MAG: hypothetical protein HOL85_21255 [Rhodospirillaceae bacterium]|jgi:hypothetical protein|nr:hypothetical protein [Rhodospirillaceae bacterium]MBT6140203.1 hypothetical protein [Rhodospirillaceae bacterium]